MRLKLPTDRDLSAGLLNIPVISFKPEDLPHFNPEPTHQYKRWEVTDRQRAVYERINAIVFAPDIHMQDLHMVATSKDCAVLKNQDSPQARPNFFVLLRPSEQMNAQETLAYITHIPSQYLSHTIPRLDDAFIGICHEFGHMYSGVFQTGIDWSAFEQEVHADSLGLAMYLEAGGAQSVAKDYILRRALGSFLAQGGAYRVAPILEERFLTGEAQSERRYETMVDGSPAFDSDNLCMRLKGYQQCGELEVRVADIISGENGLRHYSSARVQDAVLMLDRQGRYNYDIFLGLMVKRAQAFRADAKTAFRQNLPAVFSAVHDVCSDPTIDPDVKKAGQMVLQAAGRFAPALLAPELAQYQHVCNRPVAKRGLFSSLGL